MYETPSFIIWITDIHLPLGNVGGLSIVRVAHRWTGLKFAREVIRTSAMQQHQMRLSDLEHPACGQFELDSDPYLECLIQQDSVTLYHPVGTCKMGPRNDSQAVVDHQLRCDQIRNFNAFRISEVLRQSSLKEKKQLVFGSLFSVLKKMIISDN